MIPIFKVMTEYATPRIIMICILQIIIDGYIAVCNYCGVCLRRVKRLILSDSRGARLRALDAKLIEFVTDSEHAHSDNGASLCELAMVIARSMARWKEVMPRIAVAPPRRFDPEIAGALAIESVFDELLDEPSLGLLVAAFELAVSAR